MAIQLDQCRSQLVSIISTERLRECQGFIDKVGETRFNKVKNRQIKKFQNLVNKKEGNITWFSNNNNNLPQAVNNPNRQAGAPLPPGKALTPPARPLPPSYEGEGPNLLQTGSVPSSQAIAQLPSQEESNSQAIAHLPSQEGSNFPLAGGPPGSSAQGRQQFLYSSPSNQGRRHSSPQTGHSNNQNRSSSQGLRHSNRHRVTQASQENNTVSWEDNITTIPPTRPPKDLLMKILTLHGSLTSPANL